MSNRYRIKNEMNTRKTFIGVGIIAIGVISLVVILLLIPVTPQQGNIPTPEKPAVNTDRVFYLDFTKPTDVENITIAQTGSFGISNVNGDPMLFSKGSAALKIPIRQYMGVEFFNKTYGITFYNYTLTNTKYFLFRFGSSSGSMQQMKISLNGVSVYSWTGSAVETYALYENGTSYKPKNQGKMNVVVTPKTYKTFAISINGEKMHWMNGTTVVEAFPGLSISLVDVMRIEPIGYGSLPNPVSLVTYIDDIFVDKPL